MGAGFALPRDAGLKPALQAVMRHAAEQPDALCGPAARVPV